jgi:antitoxin YefM
MFFLEETTMRTANFTEFRRNLSHYLDSVIEDSDKVIIPRGGGKGVVVMSLDEYNAIAETEYLMSSPAMMKAIREAEQEIKEGKYITLHNKEEMDKYFEELEARVASEIESESDV